MRQIGAVLFDMDGVIRHWDGAGAAAGEAAAGLPPGTLDRIAYSVPEFALTQVGKATAEDWGAAIERALVAEHGPGAARAMRHFLDYMGVLDREMVGLVAAVRKQVLVALLSNATDQLRAHLTHHDLTEAFDVVLCSAELGIAKPEPDIFLHAAEAIGVDPDACFFTDDREENVAGARSVGMHAEVFTDRATLAAQLHALGLVLD